MVEILQGLKFPLSPPVHKKLKKKISQVGARGFKMCVRLSVCPSVRLSVCPSVRLLYILLTAWTNRKQISGSAQLLASNFLGRWHHDLYGWSPTMGEINRGGLPDLDPKSRSGFFFGPDASRFLGSGSLNLLEGSGWSEKNFEIDRVETRQVGKSRGLGEKSRLSRFYCIFLKNRDKSGF